MTYTTESHFGLYNDEISKPKDPNAYAKFVKGAVPPLQGATPEQARDYDHGYDRNSLAPPQVCKVRKGAVPRDKNPGDDRRRAAGILAQGIIGTDYYQIRLMNYYCYAL